MKAVDPIRDSQKISAMKNYLKGRSLRDHALFVVGINSALRITDLLDLTWGDIFEGKEFKFISVREGKSKKDRNIQLNRTARKALTELMESTEFFSSSDYIFKSREGNNSPITRQQALNILKSAARAVGIRENVGTNTLRKTWGYHAWEKGFSPALIMDILNHRNWSATKRYLGIKENVIKHLYDNLNL